MLLKTLQTNLMYRYYTGRRNFHCLKFARVDIQNIQGTPENQEEKASNPSRKWQRIGTRNLRNEKFIYRIDIQTHGL